MKEPRYALIDNQTGKRVAIFTTDEVQVAFFRLELSIQPQDGAYSERRAHCDGLRRSVESDETRKEGCS